MSLEEELDVDAFDQLAPQVLIHLVRPRIRYAELMTHFASRRPDTGGAHCILPLGASSSAFTLQVVGDANAKLFVYGAMVDNLSGDPVFYAGQ